MENTQTPLFIHRHIKNSDEAETASNLTIYNEKIIENFDNENLEATVTPIPKSSLSKNSYKQSDDFKNRTENIDEIYFEPEFSSSEFQTALRLLGKAVRFCELALFEFRKDNFIASDKAIIQLQLLLPELFCCRELSESFGAIINSVQNALSNNRGQPLSESKILALQKILTYVRNEPFMRFDKSVELIIDFEDNDFNVEPMGFDSLVELLNE